MRARCKTVARWVSVIYAVTAVARAERTVFSNIRLCAPRDDDQGTVALLCPALKFYCRAGPADNPAWPVYHIS